GAARGRGGAAGRLGGGLPFAHRLLDLAEHAVEGAAELADLGGAGPERHPAGQVAARDVAGGPLYGAERAQAPPYEPVAGDADHGEGAAAGHGDDEDELGD